ncbi:MAG TPA: glycerate kinase [Candidatus Limnocylindrales bacterium]|nr:glycerate kinase [Candidatus Limnocylindrales bacterium]
MKVVVAPDSFKGSLAAMDVANNIASGIMKVFPLAEVKKIPLSDGGEGLVDSLIQSTGGKIHYQKVKGPLLNEINAFWGILGDGKTAVIEMAAASGLLLVPEDKRNPLFTTTYGTGELIKAALDKQCFKIIVGLGGSATNDGGMGMAQALGAKFLTAAGEELPHGGGSLSRLSSIITADMDPRIKDLDLLIACDVNNPLTGPAGASYVYGPQKGATQEIASKLNQGLSHYARIVARDLGVEVEHLPGSGAAGGLGAGLLAFLSGKLRPGVEVVIETVGLEKELQNCDLVITGEGKLDHQTIFGKVPLGVARCAKKNNVPVIVLAGSVEENLEYLHDEGITAYFSIVNAPLTLEESMKNTGKLLEIATIEIMHIWKYRHK